MLCFALCGHVCFKCSTFILTWGFTLQYPFLGACNSSCFVWLHPEEHPASFLAIQLWRKHLFSLIWKTKSLYFIINLEMLLLAFRSFSAFPFWTLQVLAPSVLRPGRLLVWRSVLLSCSMLLSLWPSSQLFFYLWFSRSSTVVCCSWLLPNISIFGTH